jgi:hypothetical protein
MRDSEQRLAGDGDAVDIGGLEPGVAKILACVSELTLLALTPM